MSEHGMNSIDESTLEAGENWRMRPLVRVIVSSCCSFMLITSSAPLYAAPAVNALPQAAANWVQAGAATNSTTGNTMTINQGSSKTILNWNSFNIGKDAKVQFVQPGVDAIALNKIGGNSASEIFGQLGANGTIYLINNNGILFGETAQVNVHGLLASTLNIDSNQFLNSSISQATNNGSPALSGGTAADASITVNNGAKIQTDSGGQVLMFAPHVVNNGSIATPDGQTILAASQDKVYLAVSDNNPNLRGLLVEVDTGGDVTNVGQIVAERGNITLLGLAVNQQGVLRATTSVDVNGSIRLLARDKAKVVSDSASISNSQLADDQGKNLPTQTSLAVATEAGKVTLASGSRTEVTADNTGKTAADAQVQNLSRVDLIGKTIELQNGSSLIAKGGKVNLVATTTPDNINDKPLSKTDSRIYLGDKSLIDVSGEHVDLDMSRRIIEVELRADELKDAPLQRDGILHGAKVFVDIDKGSPLISDLSPSLAKIQRDVKERLMAGGTINLVSQGEVVIGGNAGLNVSGGSASYKSGLVNTTKLLSDGRIFDIGSADPNRIYDGILGEHTETHPKWGKSIYGQNSIFTQGTYRQGFVEGKSGGALNIDAQAMYGFDLANLQAGATAGAYQRTLATMPLGGAISVKLGQGPTSSALATVQNVVISQALLSAALGINDSFQTADGFGDVNISAAQLNRSGLGSFSLLTNGAITQNSEAAIVLKPGASFNLSGTDIDIGGSVKAPSGFINLKSSPSATYDGEAKIYNLVLRNGSVLDASGMLVNDLLDTNQAPLAPLAINGGKVTLAANGNLTLQRGSQVRSDAGAQITSAGKFVGGNGGAIALTSALAKLQPSTVPISLQLSGDLSAYGFADGGSLSLSASSIAVGAKPENTQTSTLWLEPEYFHDGSFSSYALTANQGDINLADGSSLLLRQKNLQVSSLYSAARAATGSDINAVAYSAELPGYLRKSVSLTLTASTVNGSVLLHQGSNIVLDPLASLNLAAGKNIAIDGAISARASNLNAKILADEEEQYDTGQMIWLGAGANIDARATHVAQLDSMGRDIGKTYDAGSVTLLANRGSIVAAPGSRIDVSGGTFSSQVAAANGLLKNTIINASAGAIQFSAADSIAVFGALKGSAAGPDGRGGALSYTLDANSFGGDHGTPNLNARFVDVVTTSPLWDSAINFGQALPTVFNNRAIVAADAVHNGGFTQLNLTARNTASGSSVGSYSTIEFLSDVNLSVADLLMLSSTNFDLQDHHVALSAPTIQIGQQINVGVADQASDAPHTGLGSFNVSGKFIELLGNIGISGAANTTLNSNGDVRARSPIDMATQRTLAASAFNAAGDVTLSSNQLYVSTLTDYTFNLSDTNATFKTTQISGERAPVLSAGGKLTVNAANIDLAGTMLAPLGTIAINATNSVHLRDGALLDVSANDLQIPFGRTLGGDINWLYPILLSQPLVIQNSLQKSVNITAPVIAMDSGAKVNLSGGGDIYAIEQVPGPGGSKDFLDPTNSKGAFAVVPWLNNSISPFDQVEMAAFSVNGATPAPGSIVYLDAGAGLPAGNYAILPAHYALLPGAYLVTPKASNWVQGQSASLVDGTALVGGRYGRAFTGTYNSQWLGFSVEPGSVAGTRSEFTQKTGDQFFNDTNSVKAADAGRMTVAATTALDLNGSILGAAAQNARKAQLDILADQIEIVNQKSANSQAVQLEVAGLNHLGVDSLLIGGSRSGGRDKVDVNVGATNVTIKNGATLSAPDLILVANNQIVVENGATIVGTGASTAAATQFNIAGDGAFVRASSSTQADVVRTGSSGATGELIVANGGKISSDHSLLLDATKNFSLDGTLAFTPQNATDKTSLNLTANRISLGDGSAAATDGIKFTNAALAALNPTELRLSSRSAIDFYGDVNVANARVELNTGALRSMNGGRVQLNAADTLQLDNNINASNADTISHGSLVLNAKTLELGSARDHLSGGSAAQSIMQLAGFDTVTLGSAGTTQTLHGAGNFVLRSQGDLNVFADRINAAAGTHTTVSTTGAVALTGTNKSDADANAELGGNFSLQGRALSVSGTRLEAPSGALTLAATGTASDDQLTLGAGTTIDVAGRNLVFPTGAIARSQGGVVSLSTKGGDVVADNLAAIKLGDSTKGGDAGSLTIVAKGKALWAAAIDAATSSEYQGGSLKLDVSSLDNITQWLNTISGSGLTRSIDLRARAGNITTANTDATLVANNAVIAADAGDILWNSVIDASGNNGGNIAIYAGNNLTLGTNANLNAAARAVGGRGGRVDLGVQNGNALLTLVSGSRIDVHGNATTTLDSSGMTTTRGSNGVVHLRAPRTPGNDGVNFVDHGVVITGADRIELEAFNASNVTPYTADMVSGVIDSALFDAQSFMDNQAAIKLSLGGVATNSNFHLLPGIDIWNDGDLTLDAVVDLSSKHFDGEPGVLTLRAANNVFITQDLKDGTKTNNNSLKTAAKVFLLPDYSWSYRVVAGADASAANPSRTSSAGDLTVQNGADIVTGAGNILLRAGGAIVVEDPNTVIASLGRSNYSNYITYKAPIKTESMPDTGSIDPYYLSSLNTRLPMYPQDGGNVDMAAGGNVTFAAGNSFFSDWIDRIAGNSIQLGGFSSIPKKNFDITTWGVLLDFVKQGVLALGGGNIDVAAGGSVSNLNAATPTTAKAIGTTSNQIQLIGGGDIYVTAGQDVLSPRLYADRGAINVQAAGRIGAVNLTPADINALTPEDLSAVLVLADTKVNLQAGGTIAIDSVLNSTVMPISKNQGLGPNKALENYFFTYSTSSAVSLTSTTGDIILKNSTTDIPSIFASSWASYSNTNGWGSIFSIYPSQLFASALTSNIIVAGGLTLFPSARGQLSWLVADTIKTDSANLDAIVINVSDTDVALLPSWSKPIGKEFAGNSADTPINRLSSGSIATLAHAISPVHAGDSGAAVISALNGDIATDTGLTFSVSKPLHVYAGRDIANVSFDIEHTRDNQSSEIIAGRDIGFPFAVNDVGQLKTDDNQYIRIEGPGSLDVIAGRNLNLGGSTGIESIGNQKNSALPERGATLNLFAGINGATALTDPILYNAYADRYFSSSATALPTGTYLDWFNSESSGGKINPISLISAFTGTNYSNVQDALRDYTTLPVLTKQAISLRAYERSLNTTADYSAELVSFVSLEQFAGDLTGVLLTATGQSYANNSLAAAALALLPASKQVELARTALDGAAPQQRRSLLLNILTNEIHSAGVEGQTGAGGAAAGYARGYAAMSSMFPGTQWQGNLNLVLSSIRTLQDGDINFIVPGGNVNVGLANNIAGLNKDASSLGVIAQSYGQINGVASGDFNINQSRIFSLGGGEITLWSSRGNIDAGKGAKTALTIPPPKVTFDPVTGAIKLIFPAAVAGSGIQAANSVVNKDFVARGPFVAHDDTGYLFGADTRVSRLRFIDSLANGNANLFAPQGTVNAGDAGIAVAGNLIIGAQKVLGADNISVGGIAIGVPTTTAVSAGTLSLGDVASSATESATNSMNDAIKEAAAALAESGAAFVTVDIIGVSN